MILFLSLALITQSLLAAPIRVKNILNHSQKNQMVQLMANSLKNQKMPSIVAAATLDNKVIWFEGIGYADYDKKIKVNPKFHMYRWASVSKVATERLVQAMDEKGVLDRDKSIFNYYNVDKPQYLKRCFTPSTLKAYFDCRGKYGNSPIQNIRGACFDAKTFDKFATNKGYDSWVLDKSQSHGNLIYKTKKGVDKCRIKYSIKKANLTNRDPEITLRNILNHTSGIQHYSHLGRTSEPPKIKMSDRKAIKLRKDKKKSQLAWAIPYFFPKNPLVSRPGITKTYSTFGYNLVGRILEKQSGMLFEDMLDGYANKMGAKSIQTDYLGISSRGNYSRTFVYKRQNSKFVKNNYNTDNSYKLPGGGIMSTIVDLGRFCAGMSTDGVITNKGSSGYVHTGSHPTRSRSILHLSKNKEGQKQCLVIMTNTQHAKVDLAKVRKDLDARLKKFGIWKK